MGVSSSGEWLCFIEMCFTNMGFHTVSTLNAKKEVDETRSKISPKVSICMRNHAFLFDFSVSETMGNMQSPSFLVEADPRVFRRKTAAGTLTVWCSCLFSLFQSSHCSIPITHFANQGYYASLCRVLMYCYSIFPWQRPFLTASFPPFSYTDLLFLCREDLVTWGLSVRVIC